MRATVPGLVVTLVLVSGATCVPIIEIGSGSSTVEPPTRLAVAVLQPNDSRDVARGTIVDIDWTAGNITDDGAVATVFVRSRVDRAETIIAGGILVTGSGVRQTVPWDTTNFAGGYNIFVRIEAGGLTAQNSNGAVITVNTAPTFSFTEPTADATFGEGEADPNNPDDVPPLNIRWLAGDPDGDAEAEIGLDEDTDHDSGNEIVIQNTTISVQAEVDSLAWDGTDVDGATVEAGTYNLFARVTDGVNPEFFVEGLGRITIPEEPNEPTIELAVTTPDEDVTFLTTDDPLTIEFTLDEEDDVFVDLKIDTDEDHQNGNEITILSQRLIDSETKEDSFDWNGNDSGGAAVDDGIYRVFLALSRGAGTPTLVEAEGLVFRRSSEDQPLIGLLQPDGDRTLDIGQFLPIEWRDDDPSESATIRLTLDDDGTPNEGTETDDPEIEILVGRDADGDGVQDTFNYQLPASLAPGRYFVFAYIDDGVAPFDHISIAPGQLIIEDDEMP